MGTSTNSFPDSSNVPIRSSYHFKDDNSGNESDTHVADRNSSLDFEARLQNMEAETVRVTGENVLLKQLILDSRQKQAVMQDKMEKVLKTLYNMFMGGGNSNNLSILHNPGGGQIAGGPNMVPLPPRSSLAPQMLESLIFRLDSLQTYGLRYVTRQILCLFTVNGCFASSL